MTELIVLVGLPASGKSTWAKENADKNNATIVSSDEYRKNEYGDESKQGDNHKLFEKIHVDILELLSQGKSVIFDGTNISFKHRKQFLDKVSKLENVNKTCILFATSFDRCLDRNSKRERIVPESVIKRMRENFNTPMFSEGWDNIDIKFDYNSEDYDVATYLEMADNFDQQNHNHSMTLGGHSRKVVELLVEDKHIGQGMLMTGALHDCGKPYTKVFHNMKDEPTEIAHYYFHENVGAYESLFYLNEELFSNEEILWHSAVINFHMRPYLCKTDKAIQKLVNTVGETMYEDLIILNRADRKGH